MKKEIRLKGAAIGDGHPCMIVAEISCNHLQDREMALTLIERAKDCGATAVKFQAYTPDTMTLDPGGMGDREKAHFIIKGSIWDGRSFYDLYKEAYTPWEWFSDLKQKAEGLGLSFIVTPFDGTSLDHLEKIGVELYKVASFEINHIPLLNRIAQTQKPVIFSTGCAEPDDICLALETIRGQGNDQVIILKCTSAYPAPVGDSNLMMIPAFKERYNALTGLSDHTTSAAIPAYAAALGACMVEKHFTLVKKGPDADFSLLPEAFSEMAKNIREFETARGTGTAPLTDAVRTHRAFMRSIFASGAIKAGACFAKENIRVVRPGMGMHPKYFDMLIGKKAKRDIAMGEPITKDLIAE